MISKRLFAAASALLVAASMPCYTVFAAGKEDKTEGPGYTQKSVDAVVYSEDNIVPIDLRYYDEMPNVPYISYVDFIKCWAGDEVEIKGNGDGTYELTHPFGFTAIIDTNNETISAESELVLYPTDILSDDSPYQEFFIRKTSIPVSEWVGDSDEEETYQFVLDFSYYDIDLRGDEDAVYFPVATLCDYWTTGIENAAFIMDTLFFSESQDEFFDLSLTEENEAYLLKKYKNGRPEDLGEFIYNELCFTFDCNYGYPGRPYYTDLVLEKGLDGFLLEGSDATRQVREWLLSSDFTEFLAGWRALTNLLYDGGHTIFAVPIQNEDILDARDALLADMKDPGIVDAKKLNDEFWEKHDAIIAERTAMIEENQESLNNLEILPYSTYYEMGDTAFFIFDSFMSLEIMDWYAYYNTEGELPEDVLTAFMNDVEKADQNPDIKNFVIDISANGGGYVDLALYMSSIVANASVQNTKYNAFDYCIENDFVCDKNLDKQFDELDDEFSTDLRFGVLTSGCSFSSANIFPCLCRDNGVMLIGEQSGGGSCYSQVFLTADGIPYQLSIGICTTDKNFDNVDMGIPVDYELFTENEDGTVDYSAAYNVTLLDQYFEEFYSKKSEDDPEETTEPAETTAPEVIETTPRDETTEPSSETTTEVIETTTEAVETTEPTTTTAASDEETTAYATPEKFGEMAKKDYKSKNGTAPAASETKDNGDGTYSIILTDENGDVLDTYTVDAATGKGTDSNGGIVDLPQTGNNSMSTAASAAAAAALVIAGAFAVGAAFRRKDEEE